MDTFLEIMLYSVLLLGTLTVVAAALVFLAMWLAHDEEESGAH